MKLRVCFLWHMHQPYYKDPESGHFILPWVRLHAIKDYVALPRIFSKYPKVRHTFNLVPSLLLQIRDYVENGALDTFLEVSRKNALDLSREEREFLLRNFYSAFPPTMILPQPRYEELYRRRESALASIRKGGGPAEFGASDFIDLVTLFNLTWYHPMHREEDSELDRLWRKGRDYTEKDKQYVLDRQFDLMASLIPEYRSYADRCGGELSSTPMYHPILPLLVDNRSAQDAVPGAPLPRLPFAFPADARAQLEKGREFFREAFGKYPNGLWPSEGSISPDSVELAVKSGFRWAATDELLLSRALGRSVARDADGVPCEPDWIYRPYRARTPSGDLSFFFRDHHLSDLIGFEYSRWNSEDAANNFVSILKKIHYKCSSGGFSGGSPVVPVILDGENAWEYYYDSGRLFLQALLCKLEKISPDIECVTFSQALESSAPLPELPSIPTGSWIDGTFYIWIGHEEDRAAWDALSRARHAWEAKAKEGGAGGATPPELEEAYEHLLVAEGSDWCWWYGDDHFTPHGPEFDSIFRHHIKAAYKLIGINPPDNLDIPIIKESKIPSAKNFLPSPRSYISPKIDGILSSYFDWSAATRYIPMPEFGAMHRAGFGLLTAMYYGFSRSHLFLRLDLHPSMGERPEGFRVEFVFPVKNRKVICDVDPAGRSVDGRIEPVKGDDSDPVVDCCQIESGGLQFGFVNVLEAGIPFSRLDCEGESRIEFYLTIQAAGGIGERWPMYGTFTADLPGSDFEERMWQI